MKIDVHAHFYPRRYLETLDRLTQGDSSPWTLGVRKLLTEKILVIRGMVDIEAHLEDMDRAGVDMQALSLSIPQTYFEDEQVAVELAKITNDELAETCAKYPTRFKGFAVLPLPHVEASVKEMDRAINSLGLHGVTLGANVKGRHLDDESFLPVYREMDRQKLTIFMHPMIPPGQSEMADYDLSPAVGFHIDTTLAVLRLVYRGVFEESRDLKLIVPHLGAYLPYNWDRVRRSWETRPEARVHISRPPTGYMRDFYYDNVNFHPPAYDCILQTVGAGQLMLGSDYPFALGSMEAAVACIDALDLTAEQKETIFSGNALKLLR